MTLDALFSVSMKDTLGNGTRMRPNDAMDGVVKQYLKQSAKPESFFDEVEAFIYAIDWKAERWLQGLGAFYFVLVVVAVASRKNWTIQSTLMLTCLAGALCAETLNDLGKKHWREFSTQDYFDDSGLFMSAIFSGPLLSIATCILVNCLCLMGSLVIKVKRLEFARERKKGKRAAKSGKGKTDAGIKKSRSIPKDKRKAE
uniref:Transmembrane protein 18 n=1 Tax=Lotharella oceanica TaxID=641309 RepID=A0A7S2TQG9_9EUKA